MIFFIKLPFLVNSILSLSESRMKKFLVKIADDDLPTHAAALAYYCALSLAPLAVVTILVLSYLPASIDQILFQVRNLFGSPAADLAKSLFEKTAEPSTRTTAGIASVGISLIFASAAFAQLQNSFNRIFGVRSRPFKKWLSGRIQSMIWVFLFILLLFLAGFFVQILQWAGVTDQGSPEDLAGWGVKATGSILVPTLLFRYLPQGKVAWKAALLGGVLSGVGFELGARAIQIYLREAAWESAYGTTGVVVIFLLWVYYSSLVLLFCAEVVDFLNPHPRKCVD